MPVEEVFQRSSGACAHVAKCGRGERESERTRGGSREARG